MKLIRVAILSLTVGIGCGNVLAGTPDNLCKEERTVFQEEYDIEDIIPAKFNGGTLMTFRNWVIMNVVYPEAALYNMIEGRVVVSFVINKDGVLQNIEVLQSPNNLLSDEVMRVVKMSPKWQPAMNKDGEPVNFMYHLPIDFSLQE